MPQSADRPRIVSLIASATEIVCALGLKGQLVGRSHECDDPPSVRSLPAVTVSHIDATQSSAHIHQQVTEGRSQAMDPAAALSIYEVNEKLLDELRPDLIVTQSQCQVCAVSLEQVERAVGRMVQSRPRIVSLEPNDLEDVWSDIQRVGDAASVPGRAAQLVSALRGRIDRVAARSRLLEAVSVACIEWIEPLMVAGNWVPKLVELAGGRDLLGTPGKHSPWLDWDRLRAADPDVILAMPCGFDLDKTVVESVRLFEQPIFRELRAARSGRVYAVDGNAYFNRPGPRLVESLEILAEIMHPRDFSFGHEGSGWKRMHP